MQIEGTCEHFFKRKMRNGTLYGLVDLGACTHTRTAYALDGEGPKGFCEYVLQGNRNWPPPESPINSVFDVF